MEQGLGHGVPFVSARIHVVGSSTPIRTCQGEIAAMPAVRGQNADGVAQGKQERAEKQERGRPASFLFLPVGLADLVIGVDARPQPAIRQQHSCPSVRKKEAAPAGATSLTGRMCPAPEDIRHRSRIKAGTKWLILYGCDVAISGRGARRAWAGRFSPGVAGR